ncbi:NEDD8-activating enzyme E1 catalytic subunit-like [Diadema antillarum]|uniref:NEDD8-activating enzyme E1 catalytic subunit-like n=1 Tax=Diadema antillarum TaxID=105358 RepID=UPI003A836A55
MAEEPMTVDDNDAAEWPGRWDHIKKLLERSGPFATPEFEPSPELLGIMLEHLRVLVIGAGGLGCEILKDLALSGFRQIDVIDMDTIDLSNLNRQFLFRTKDVGKAKATCAADFINNRVAGCNVTPHFKRIEDFDETFYSQFHLIICGLDSIVARRWMNGMLLSMISYDEDGNMDPNTVKPMIDGGTEGFKGNARVIIPGTTPCIECTLDLYPPQVNFPMCTIAHTPRLPEHCIEYAKVLLWPQEEPFGAGVGIDGDDPSHIQWIFEKAQERADQFNIAGVTYRLTQGVVKRIIPAVASTNAVIAAQCVTEAFKIATSCCFPLKNYMVFNDTDGLYTYTYEAERKEDCLACSQAPQMLEFPEDATLQTLVDHLTENNTLQMKAPSITTTMNGRNKTLYMQSVEAIRKKTKENLPKKLTDLGLSTGQELVIADATTPNSLVFSLKLVPK